MLTDLLEPETALLDDGKFSVILLLITISTCLANCAAITGISKTHTHTHRSAEGGGSVIIIYKPVLIHGPEDAAEISQYNTSDQDFVVNIFPFFPSQLVDFIFIRNNIIPLYSYLNLCWSTVIAESWHKWLYLLLLELTRGMGDWNFIIYRTGCGKTSLLLT